MVSSESFLLFLDSFSHDKYDEQHADVVCFNKPTIIQEVRVLPFGIAVQSEDQTHLGATNPANFEVIFYTSPLSGQNAGVDASVFQEAGRLEYDERSRDTALIFSSQQPTSILVLRGHYSTLTLAVFGVPPGHPPPNALLPTPMAALAAAAPYNLSQALAGYVAVATRGAITPVFSTAHNQTTLPMTPYMSGPYSGGHLEPGEIYDDRRCVQRCNRSPGGRRGARGGGGHRGGYNNTVELDIVSVGLAGCGFGEAGTEPGEIAEEGEDGEIQDGELQYEEISSDDFTEFDDDDGMEFTVIDADCDVTDEQLELFLEPDFKADHFVSILNAPRLLVDPSFTALEAELALLKIEISLESESSKDFANDDNLHPTINQRHLEMCRSAAQRLLAFVEKYYSEGCAILVDSECIGTFERMVEQLPIALAQLSCVATAEDMNRVGVALIALCEYNMDLDFVKTGKNVSVLRHLKFGAQLASQLGAQDENLAKQALNRGLQWRILKLLHNRDMATSVKLQLLRALDRSTRLQIGMDSFVGRAGGEGSVGKWMDDNNKLQLNTPYRRLVSFVMNVKNTSRVVVACTALINKVHLYELILDFSAAIAQLRVNENCARVSEHAGVLLQELLKIFMNAESRLGQPRGSLPFLVRFDFGTAPYDPYPDFFHFLDVFDFVESLQFIVCGSFESSCKELYSPALNFLTELAGSERGLLFLSARPSPMKELLVKLVSNNIALGTELVCKLAGIMRLDALLLFHRRDPNALNHYESSALMTTLRGLLQIESRYLVQLLSWGSHVRALLPLLELKSGRCAKEKTLRQPAALGYAALLLLVCFRRGGKYAPKLAEQCVERVASATAAVEAQGAGSSKLNELQEWMRPYRLIAKSNLTCNSSEEEAVRSWVEQVRQLSEERPGESSPALVSALRHLRMLTVSEKNHRTLEAAPALQYDWMLAELLSLDGQNLLLKLVQSLSEQLLRPWQRGLEPVDSRRYALVLSALEPTLDMICALLQRVICARSTAHRDLSSLQPLFQVYGVFCALPTCLSERWLEDHTKLRNHVVQSLLAYTQFAFDYSDEQTASFIEKSLWTRMLKELLNFTMSSPHFFLAGLQLLAEILPLPPPPPSSGTTCQFEEKFRGAYSLWSAHLLCVSSEINELVQLIGCSSNPILVLALRRVIVQIASLGAPCISFLVRGVVEGFAEAWERARRLLVQSVTTVTTASTTAAVATVTNVESNEKNAVLAASDVIGEISGDKSLSSSSGAIMLEDTNGIENKKKEESAAQSEEKQDVVTDIDCPDSVEITRLYGCITLICEASSLLKFALLDLLVKEVNADVENASESGLCSAVTAAHLYFSSGIELLRCPSVNREQHGPSQEAFLHSFLAIVDLSHDIKNLQDLVNYLPNANQLSIMASELLNHIRHKDQDMATVHVALKILIKLAEHDFGFGILKSSLYAAPDVLLNLLKRVNNTFSKDNADCLITLLTTLDLLRTLVIVENPAGEGVLLRSFALSIGEIKSFLHWPKQGNEDHPVLDLHHVLKEYVKEEKSMEDLLKKMNSVIGMLNNAETGSIRELLPTKLPNRQTLLEVQDSITAVGQECPQPPLCELLFEPVWLQAHLMDSNQENSEETPVAETMRCDLENLAYACCPLLQLRSELERGTRGHQEEAVRHKKRRRGHAIIATGGRSHKKFVAPMRGRGFGLRVGQVPTTNTRGYDPFRQRPPNTSRPPSMHVDDFEKLEAVTPEDVASEEEIRGGLSRRSANFGRHVLDDRFRMPPPFRPRHGVGGRQGHVRSITK